MFASTFLSPRRLRRFVIDLALAAASFAVVAMLPRILSGEFTAAFNLLGILPGLLIFSGLSGIILVLSGTSRMIWRYVSFNDLLALVRVAFFSTLAFVAVEFILGLQFLMGSNPAEYGAIALLFVVETIFLAAPRLVIRAMHEVRLPVLKVSLEADDRIPALIAGDAGRVEAFIRETVRNPRARYRIVGILTDEAKLQGSVLQGVIVLGGISNLPQVAEELRSRGIQPESLILARDDLSNEQIQNYLDLTTAAKLKVSRLPPHGVVDEVEKLRPLDLTDLLGRPEVVMDTGSIAAMVAGKRVMVTGAGGSIGSELCRQIAGYGPSLLIVADNGEFNLYSIDKELSESFPQLPFEAALIDVRDGDMVSTCMERHRPQLVFHAAALKHVPLLESNPIEAVKTNVVGTINVAEACVRHGVSAMVTISTDKAVNPTNVMGATKRLAESYCQGLDQSEANNSTRFITVRFGNVLGSSGSVVPLFTRQIEAGGPVTITHPEITRFFMTIPEAVLLVLQAGAQGHGGKHQRGNIYVLEMGKAVKIIDLAHQMIQLSGNRPNIDIEIKVVGLRPGEKLYEEVAYGDESVLPTECRSIMQLAPRTTDLRIIRQQVQELRTACAAHDTQRVVRLMKVSVPEFKAEPASRAASS